MFFKCRSTPLTDERRRLLELECQAPIALQTRHDSTENDTSFDGDTSCEADSSREEDIACHESPKASEIRKCLATVGDFAYVADTAMDAARDTDAESFKEDEEKTGMMRKKRRWIDKVGDGVEVQRRARNEKAKGHVCTECNHFRISKFFDSSYLTCISCLNICVECRGHIEVSDIKRRAPRCGKCIEKNKVKRRQVSRLCMKNKRFNLKKK